MMVSGLEYLDQPKEMAAVATLFSGGLGLGDHCGYYTAGLMLIGLAFAGIADRSLAPRLRKAFTEEWKVDRPLLCREIKAAGAPPANCGEIGLKVAEMLGKLLERAAADPRRARFAVKASGA